MAGKLEKQTDDSGINYFIEVMVIFSLMSRLGFPGNLTIVFGGERLGKLMDYGVSVLQVIIIMMCSANNIWEIKLMQFKKKHLPIYLMLVLMFAISLGVNPNKVKQTTILIRFSITIIFGLWMGDNYDMDHLLNIMYFAQIGNVMANLLTLFVFRNAGFHYDEDYGYCFSGLYAQKNALGGVFAVGLALQYALLRLKLRKKQPISYFFWGMFAIQAAVLAYSQATTATFTAILSITYLTLYEKMDNRNLRIQWGIAYVVASVSFMIVAMTIIPLFTPFLEAIGKDATLTGRIPMWDKMFDFLLENNTMTGYGVFQFWETPSALNKLHTYYERNSWYRRMANGAHSNMMEMWLDTGLIGISAYYLTLIYVFRDVKWLSNDQYNLVSVLMLPLLIAGLTDRIYNNQNYTSLFLFVMLSIACDGTEKKRKARRKARRRRGRRFAQNEATQE